MIVVKSRKGQSIVETALVLPLILMILLSIIEFGRIFNAYLVITNASREGARAAAVGASDAEIMNRIINTAGTLNAVAMKITVSPSTLNRIQGSQVTVMIDYGVDIITPLIGGIIPDPYKLSAKTVMRIE